MGGGTTPRAAGGGGGSRGRDLSAFASSCAPAPMADSGGSACIYIYVHVFFGCCGSVRPVLACMISLVYPDVCWGSKLTGSRPEWISGAKIELAGFCGGLRRNNLK
ncbi:hypothetical protein NL676_025843 [Syzygium grande]|nr:hypothetical protein NL676_025843 [Syzygium grande]